MVNHTSKVPQLREFKLGQVVLSMLVIDSINLPVTLYLTWNQIPNLNIQMNLNVYKIDSDQLDKHQELNHKPIITHVHLKQQTQMAHINLHSKSPLKELQNMMEFIKSKYGPKMIQNIYHSQAIMLVCGQPTKQVIQLTGN